MLDLQVMANVLATTVRKDIFKKIPAKQAVHFAQD
jgi:hypothetical protein